MVIEAPAEKIAPIELAAATKSSARHEIEMPYREIKLELDYAS